MMIHPGLSYRSRGQPLIGLVALLPLFDAISVGNISSTGLDFGLPSMGPGGEPYHSHCFDDAHLTGAHGGSK
ncbi:unnamed protein product, partial [Cyprideis torosa]